ncbi:hypothetical protein [Parathalassolituus penaei]|uniref:Uncharacterized protein n=1 Tax=Parathalassolituus penaei TaxID=2997323 RepID=A0A9X3IU91_9GAMM|nr:hypothetical protein [Parathalassolituus penaei]MCY0967130.1 hypothetical protein [Parathalassolituus penaei]
MLLIPAMVAAAEEPAPVPTVADSAAVSATAILPDTADGDTVAGDSAAASMDSDADTSLSDTSSPDAVVPVVAPDAVPATSATDTSAELDQELDEVSSDLSESEESRIERSRHAMAGYLDHLSGQLDGFFVDTFFNEDILEDDVRGSSAVLSSYTRRKIGEPVDYRFGLSVKLVFPHTNERLNLLVQSEEEENRESNPLESIENNNYTAALRFIIREGEQWKTDIDTGIRWGFPPDPFSRFRARRYFSLPGWDFRATQRLFYYSSDGWGEDSAVQIDHPIAEHKLLRLNAKAGYQLNDDYFKLNYSAALYHELSSRAAIGFISGASGDTRQDLTFNSYSSSVRYRRQIYSNWVFAEIAPELVWEAAHEYKTVPALMLRLEAVIGR